nr:hypothetical protein [Gardnerella greenwoodii]
MSDGTQISDTHIVAVAGHGVDPSPVPPEPEGYEPSGFGGFWKNRKNKKIVKRAEISSVLLMLAIKKTAIIFLLKTL